jgi:hypothetical protein
LAGVFGNFSFAAFVFLLDNVALNRGGQRFGVIDTLSPGKGRWCIEFSSFIFSCKDLV